jgi:exoribonuclease-2
MSEAAIRENSLVLYRARPARIQRADEKLSLELEGGESAKVRAKDVTPLHPGPLKSLAELRPIAGDVQTAWEILAGGDTTLAELAELAYGAFTPSSAWAAWQVVTEGLYFRGTPERIAACTADEVAHTQAARAAEAAEKEAWEAFVARAKAGKVAPEDRRYLRDVEDLALGRNDRSRVLKALGREESYENAHATLLEFGYWDETINPYPSRYGLTLAPPALSLPEPWHDPARAMLTEERRDLTHLPAFAIDDPWTDTPDDAVSFEPETGRLWVHVADAAALVAPDSPLDLEARARATSLYLPEAVVPMLPDAATPALGLGLGEVSPALSFALTVNADGELTEVEVVPSLVHVSRLSYEEAETRLAEEPFRTIYALGLASEARRQRDGAMRVDMPEVSVRVRDGEVSIRSIPPLRSRDLVQYAMILAGEAAARFGTTRGIPLPFATQEPPDLIDDTYSQSLSAMFARRRTFRRSQYRSVPAPHSGLGLNAYAQATSPMRRYLDLVVHQQLRAYLANKPLLTPEQILERVGAVEAILPSTRPAEQYSERHWILVYLLRHPEWRGRGVLVDKRSHNSTVIIPELGLEPSIRLSADLPLDSELTLSLRSVDLPRLDARFRVDDRP